MKNSSLFLLAALAALSGCAGLAAGAGATLGVAAAQEGGLSAATTDTRIKLEINDLWFRYDVDMFRKLDITVNQGRVLLTGVVQNPEHRVEAVRLAWQPKGVKQVINEIRVDKSDGITGYARDTWITARLRTAITFDRNIQSINYSIDTVQGIVYLMGYAQNQDELNRVIEKARTITDVKQVVSYVKLVGEKNQGGQEYQEPTYHQPAGQDSYGGQDNNYDPNGYGQSPANGGPAEDGPVQLTPDYNNQYKSGSVQSEVLR